ncbi:MAG: hypothetical protein HY975_03000, partial [Candidatus Kerfeldbacteria bacterium]|nr:hypothetical protein [Candidatus Kerfeldbacteria bacterium]
MQQLPTVRRNTDYTKYLHLLKKNHHLAQDGVKQVRAKSAELEQKGQSGYFQYRALALGACNHPSLVAVDKDRLFYSEIEKIKEFDEDRMHRINSILDAAIDHMSRIQPAPSPSEGRGFTQNINTSATANATATAEVQILELVQRVENELAATTEG